MSRVNLQLDANEARCAIVAFIRRQFQQAGFSRAVLGLSGGVDSALACVLTVEALGPENVRVLFMPYGDTNPAGEADARMLADGLDVRWTKIDIAPFIEPFRGAFPTLNARRLGNIMARMRMIILYDQSEEDRSLVVGTGNKTELLLGYFTLWGDSAVAMRPLGDLYKCQVRQLAQLVGVPRRIITKPPSADLWEGQTDEGELGFSYDDADQILHLRVEEGLAEPAIAERGYSPALVAKVMRRLRATEFKRAAVPTPSIQGLHTARTSHS